uniref:Uncharacterized protein n=1 Tax=Hyaloperonospora arabidopsidis (strain Emoy2) TaxID=559515 RepID=M4C0T3_HYAAE
MPEDESPTRMSEGDREQERSGGSVDPITRERSRSIWRPESIRRRFGNILGTRQFGWRVAIWCQR